MKSGRPLGFNFRQALGGATASFWSRGYEACSLQDLLKATGLSKSSLYQQFGNKQKLFESCLDHYSEEMAALMQTLLDQSPTGMTFIRMKLDQVISEPQPARGCLLFNSAVELGQSNAQVADQLQTGLNRFRGVFRQALARDQAAGTISADADLEALTDYLLTSIGGLRAMVKLGTPKPNLRSTADIVLRTLEQA